MEKNKYKYYCDLFKAGNIKISIAGLTKKLECNQEMRNKCQGACCKGHNAVMLPTFSVGEKIKQEIENLVENKKVKFNRCGECELIDYCISDGSGRPIECKLAPLGFNKSGRLVMKRWAWLRPCPAYGFGEPIYISMADCLKETFGLEIYDVICWMIKNNIEDYVKPNTKQHTS